MTPTVVIAGAGIGGLTLAIALRRRGVPVTVLERAPELRPVGAGLGLGPNAMAALERLGVVEAIVNAGAAITRSAILDERGRVLGSELDVERMTREVGAPFVALHRTRLHEVLLDALGPGSASRSPGSSAGFSGLPRSGPLAKGWSAISWSAPMACIRRFARSSLPTGLHATRAIRAGVA